MGNSGFKRFELIKPYLYQEVDFLKQHNIPLTSLNIFPELIPIVEKLYEQGLGYICILELKFPPNRYVSRYYCSKNLKKNFKNRQSSWDGIFFYYYEDTDHINNFVKSKLEEVKNVEDSKEDTKTTLTFEQLSWLSYEEFLKSSKRPKSILDDINIKNKFETLHKKKLGFYMKEGYLSNNYATEDDFDNIVYFYSSQDILSDQLKEQAKQKYTEIMKIFKY